MPENTPMCKFCTHAKLNPLCKRACDDAEFGCEPLTGTSRDVFRMSMHRIIELVYRFDLFIYKR